MKKLKCYIYGAGVEYNRVSSRLMAYKEEIEVLGIVTTEEQRFSILDGRPCIRPEKMNVSEMDFVIIAVQKWKEVFEHLKKLGIAENKILRSTIFSIPNFDLKEYLRLNESNISILANTCLGGRIYKELSLKTLSPTINTASISYGEYIEFIRNYEYYLSLDMEVTKKSEDSYISGTFNRERFMPSGQLDGKLTWCFPHVDSALTAITKWNETRHRVNFNNIAALMIIQTDYEAIQFSNLPIKKKLGFYYKDLNLESVVYVPEWNNKSLQLRYSYDFSVFIHRYATNVENISKVDWIKFLNGRSDFLRY